MCVQRSTGGCRDLTANFHLIFLFQSSIVVKFEVLCISSETVEVFGVGQMSVVVLLIMTGDNVMSPSGKLLL